MTGSLPDGLTYGGAAYIDELEAATGLTTRGARLRGTALTGAEGFALAVDQNHVAYVAGYFHGANCEIVRPAFTRYPTTWDAQKRELSSGGTGSDAVLSIVDFRFQDPKVRYSTMLGGLRGRPGVCRRPGWRRRRIPRRLHAGTDSSGPGSAAAAQRS